MQPAERAGGLEGLEQEVAEMRRSLQEEQEEMRNLSEQLKELFMRNNCEEYLSRLERRIQVIENKQVETVHWRIKNVDQLRVSYSRGQFISSPEFSACGLDGFKFHLYPKGDDFAEEGYCSLYFHVPDDTRVMRTLFVGRARHGPVEADSLKNCGVSELCVLGNQRDKATDSVIVGVDGLQILSSTNIVEERKNLHLKSGDMY